MTTYRDLLMIYICVKLGAKPDTTDDITTNWKQWPWLKIIQWANARDQYPVKLISVPKKYSKFYQQIHKEMKGNTT